MRTGLAATVVARQEYVAEKVTNAAAVMVGHNREAVIKAVTKVTTANVTLAAEGRGTTQVLVAAATLAAAAAATTAAEAAVPRTWATTANVQGVLNLLHLEWKQARTPLNQRGETGKRIHKAEMATMMGKEKATSGSGTNNFGPIFLSQNIIIVWTSFKTKLRMLRHVSRYSPA